MKNSIVALFCIGLIVSIKTNVYSQPSSSLSMKSAAQTSGPIIDGYRLTATTNKKAYSAGEKINFVLTIKNMAKTRVNVAFGSDLSFFQVDILGPDGKTVGYTPYGHEVFDTIQGGSAFVQTLNQGVERYVKVDINDYYDMSSPGKYKIIASRKFPRRENLDQYVLVTSNPVVVIVSPVKPKPLGVKPSVKSSVKPM